MSRTLKLSAFALGLVLPALMNSPLAAAQQSSENCFNEVDDDGDGKTDCFDKDCEGLWICLPPQELCANGVDDNRNGFTDCADQACFDAPVCTPNVEQCANGNDDDGDGDIDCADADCAEIHICTPNVELCHLPGDEDGDGDINCEDADCAYAPNCNIPEEMLGPLRGDPLNRKIERLKFQQKDKDPNAPAELEPANKTPARIKPPELIVPKKK